MADPTELQEHHPVTPVLNAAAKVTCFITALEEVVDADAISDVRLDQTLNELAGTLEGAKDCVQMSEM